MGLGRAAGRLIELGERKRGAQNGTARALCFAMAMAVGKLPRRAQDRSGRASVGFRRAGDAERGASNDARLGPRGATRRRCEPARCPRPASPPRAAPAIRVEPQIDPNALIHECRENPSNLGCAGYESLIRPRAHPECSSASCEVVPHPVLSRDSLQSLAALNVAKGSPRQISRYDFQKSASAIVGMWQMSVARRVGRVDQFTRAFDLAQLPQSRRGMSTARGRRKRSRSFRVGVEVASLERSLAMGSRLNGNLQAK